MSAHPVKVKTTQLRAELAEIINRVVENRSRATIMRHGDPIAAVMSQAEVEEFDRLKELFKSFRQRGLYNFDDIKLPPA